MEENIYYHIHKINNETHEKEWYEGSTIIIGKKYNSFYKYSIDFQAKFPVYENLKDVPWSNVYKYIIGNNKLDFIRANELLEHANNIINEYQILLRETAYEDIRREYFPELPSRTSCIWLCKEKQVEFWKKQFIGNNYEIFMVKVFGKVFKTNNSMIVSPSDSYNQIKNMGRKYWSYNEKLEKEDDEYLYVGKLEVIKKLII